jgi:hypothetical protein
MKVTTSMNMTNVLRGVALLMVAFRFGSLKRIKKIKPPEESSRPKALEIDPYIA